MFNLLQRQQPYSGDNDGDNDEEVCGGCVYQASGKENCPSVNASSEKTTRESISLR